jgi:hypothetical protein
MGQVKAEALRDAANVTKSNGEAAVTAAEETAASAVKQA